MHKKPRRTGKHGVKSMTDSVSSFPRTKPASKQLDKLFTLYQEAKDTFDDSALAERLQSMMNAKTRPRITKAISLGLGSLGASKDQPRRIKQLVIFLAIASYLAASQSLVPLYAQDPTFTSTDEAFLSTFGIKVLKTPSPSELGEAADLIDSETLVYSPFLTIAAYTSLFVSGSKSSSLPGSKIPVLIGDDFNALKLKWEKRTTEHRDVEALIKAFKARNYQRRVISGDGFWHESDNPFPMALYWGQSSNSSRDGPRANKL